MNEHKLSHRLAEVATYVPKQARLADIGSDHGYLPAWLILNQVIDFAVAGEVVEGPFSAAQKRVRGLHLENQIVVRLADGLGAIKPEDNITAITICGMGGTLISEILTQGVAQQQLTGKERLILQPNIGEWTLRNWLMRNQYRIVAEKIVTEDEKMYEIIVAEKSVKPVSYSFQELHFGPYLLQEKSLIFKQKWQSEFSQKQLILKQLKQAKTPQIEKIAWLTKLITEIKEVL